LHAPFFASGAWFPARGFRRAASSAPLPALLPARHPARLLARGFRRAASGARLPARGFRRCFRRCIRRGIRRGFWRAASGARLPARGFWAASGAPLPARRFRQRRAVSGAWLRLATADQVRGGRGGAGGGGRAPPRSMRDKYQMKLGKTSFAPPASE